MSKEQDILQYNLQQQRDILLGKIAQEFTNGTIDQKAARGLAQEYATNRKDHYNTHVSRPIAQRIASQPWLDALTGLLNNNWRPMQEALVQESGNLITGQHAEENALALRKLARII